MDALYRLRFKCTGFVRPPRSANSGPVIRGESEMYTRACGADAAYHGPTSTRGVYEHVVNGVIVALELFRTGGAMGQAQLLWVQSSGSGEPPFRPASKF